MIAIIDYGAGNIQSVRKALKHIGCDCFITNKPDEILHADGAVLPGVGAFGDTTDSLNRLDLRETIKSYIRTDKPFLGICLGLQLLFPASEESPEAEGLNLFAGSIRKIPEETGLKIPHMGWNSLDVNPSSKLFQGIEKNPYVYFVHSYYLNAYERDIVVAQADYGIKIDAAIESGNVFSTQFHPEKSGEIGLHILKNFASIVEG